jgi:outer membrane receptor protein involved in Fe transport
MKAKILLFILLAFPQLIFSQSEILNKKISIAFNNVKLEKALFELQKEAGISFAFNNNQSEMKDVINFGFEEKAINEILDSIFANKSLLYKIIENQIVIYSKNENPKSQKNNNNGRIKGKVIDKKNKEPLLNINISVIGTFRGTMTDEEGNFLIDNLSPDKYALLISSVGYSNEKVENINVIANKTTQINTIETAEETIPLSEVVVAPGSYSLMGKKPTMQQTLTSEDIKMMGWAEDITRAIGRIPGISSNDFSAKFNIRGGETDEVLVLLDGMELYEPFHQKDFGGGLFSTVDIETIEGVELLTGGFTSEYGDKMSGVLNMETKNPYNGKDKTSLGLSLMNAHVFSMNSFNNDKGSWLISARRGFLDLLNKLTNNEFNLTPIYYDMFGKIEYKLSEYNTLSLHLFHSSDAYNLDEKVKEPGTTWFNIDFVDTKYGNSYSWLTLKSIFSKNLFARSLLYGGVITKKRFWDQYDNDINAHLNSATLYDDRDFKLVGFKQDWDFEISNKFLLRFGFDIKTSEVKFDYSNNIDNEFVTAEDSLIKQTGSLKSYFSKSGNQLGTYLSTRFNIFKPLTLETGIRYDYASHTNDKLFSPRINLLYSLNRSTSIRVGWGYFYQTQPIDELLVQHNINEYNSAELAKHYVLGFEHQFDKGLQFRIEGYYKQITDIPDSYRSFANIDEFFPEARTDLIKVSTGKAISKGIELYLKYDKGDKISGWLSYVLSNAKENITNLDYRGKLIEAKGYQPREWDQKHTINIEGNYRYNKNWLFNISWQYRTGWPYTPFTVQRKERDDGTFAIYHAFGEFNGNTYPAFHRLDFRINKYFYTSTGKVNLFLHIINVYNHENINNYDHDVIKSTKDVFQYEIVKELWFGILPFIGVNWEL